MTNHEINTKLRAAVESSVPDVWEGISAGLQQDAAQASPVVAGNKAGVSAARTKRPPRWLGYVLTAAAAVALTLGTVWGVVQYTNTVDSVVMLDVNPSVKLTATSRERVISAVALNTDGEKVLADMDLAGTDLEVAVNALMGSMLRQGYIDNLANSVLLTVQNPDAAKSRALQEKLSEDIDGQLAAASVASSILSQSLPGDAAQQALAEAHGISAGKVALIQKVLEKNPHLTFESLVGLSVNELNLLLKGTDDVEGLASTGRPSEDVYIGAVAAEKAALRHAGVAAADAILQRTEMDFDDGVMVYDVEFTANGMEYEYEIDALDGRVVSHEVVTSTLTPQPQVSSSGSAQPPAIQPQPQLEQQPAAPQAPVDDHDDDWDDDRDNVDDDNDDDNDDDD